jgi:hypothetical protein
LTNFSFTPILLAGKGLLLSKELPLHIALLKSAAVKSQVLFEGELEKIFGVKS